MCATKRLTMAASALCAVWLAACTSPGRTGTNFCRQLQKELPGIAAPIESPGDANTMVGRYKRLLTVAPLTIQKDFATLTDLLDLAAHSNPNKTDELQKVADAAYAANSAARNVAAWVKDTCAVDIRTGVSVPPPRKPVPTTTTAPPQSTTTAAP